MITVSAGEFRAMLADPDARWTARMLALLPVSGVLDGAAEAPRELAAALADPDPAVRSRAEAVRGAELWGDLAAHVHVVLELLLDESAADAWPGCLDVLGALAPGDQFELLVDVLARPRSVGLGERLAIALGLPGRGELSRFTVEQAGRDASVVCLRCTSDVPGDASRTVSATRCWRLPALVALLGSRHAPVRRRAVAALADLGPGAAGVLRTARRTSPAPVRRAALEALVAIGWRELDPADRDLLTRFLRVRRHHPLLPTALRECAWPWRDLTAVRHGTLERLPHNDSTERDALAALTAALADLPPPPVDEPAEALFRRFDGGERRLARLSRWPDLATRETVTALLRAWAATADPPVPDRQAERYSGQVAAIWARTTLAAWAYEVLRWLARTPGDARRIGPVARRCAVSGLATREAVTLLDALGAPYGEEALLRLVRDERVDESSRALARRGLVTLRRPGYDACAAREPEPDEEPLLPPAVRTLPFGWDVGFEWPYDLPETVENVGLARAILAACAPDGPVIDPAPDLSPATDDHVVDDDDPPRLEIRSVMRRMMPHARQVTRERLVEVLDECALLGMPCVPGDPAQFVRRWVGWIEGWIVAQVFRWLGMYVDDSTLVTPWAMDRAEQYARAGLAERQAVDLLGWHRDVPRSREILARLAADDTVSPTLRARADAQLRDILAHRTTS